MPKRKHRSGLQKDFSKIFQGVWVPKKPHVEPETGKPTSDQRNHVLGTPGPDEQNELIEQMERIIGSMKCSKDFECFKSGFQNLCKVNNIGDGKIIECSPENQGACEYRFSLMNKNFCKCQLRHYIARYLNK